jgi:hypothetical protein
MILSISPNFSYAEFDEKLNEKSHFGKSIINIGDFDGDGITDLAVGAPGDDDGGLNSGAIYILFMNDDGTVKSHQKISDSEGNFEGKLLESDRFGRSIANIGDFDGDGITDLAVGAYRDDDGGLNSGAIYILFMNDDGTVKSHQKISDSEGNFTDIIVAGDCFGNAITSLGDLDGDGIVDLAVGAHDNYTPGTKYERIGAVHILFLNSDGTVKNSQEISDTKGNFGVIESNAAFGNAISNIGDLDGDGIVDLAVGSYGDNDTEFDTGAVFVIFLNIDGTVKSHQKISSIEGNFDVVLGKGDTFGTAVESIGDLDGDGIIDLAIGAQGDDDGKSFLPVTLGGEASSSKGAVYILFMNNDGTVKSHQKISADYGNFHDELHKSDRFGYAIANMGDLNDDGVNDIIVGAPYDDDGVIYALFLNNDGTVLSSHKIPEEKKVGGACLIATATYGSELAPQVQQLRELRDNTLLQTKSGIAFMGMFNDVYYSFSPVIADMERENPLFKEAVKLAITPLIFSLSLMENAESDSEVLGLGLSVIALNLGMYLGVPAIVVIGIRKRI